MQRSLENSRCDNDQETVRRTMRLIKPAALGTGLPLRKYVGPQMISSRNKRRECFPLESHYGTALVTGGLSPVDSGLLRLTVSDLTRDHVSLLSLLLLAPN